MTYKQHSIPTKLTPKTSSIYKPAPANTSENKNNHKTTKGTFKTIFPILIKMSNKNHSVLPSVDCLRDENILLVFPSCIALIYLIRVKTN